MQNPDRAVTACPYAKDGNRNKALEHGGIFSFSSLVSCYILWLIG